MRKLSDAERLEIARRLAVMDRQMLVGVREVAVLYNTTVASIQQACSVKRIARGDVALRLPERVSGLGRRVAWLHGDVRDCIAQAQAHAGSTAPGAAGADLGQPAKALQTGAQDATKTSSKPRQNAVRMGRKRKA